MSTGALFGNVGGRAQSKNLVEFRAGKMTMKGRMVHADKRKGMVYIYQSEDSLMHFCWRERSKNTAEDDFIIFPEDVEYKAVKQCTTGRVFLLKFRSNNRMFFYWMQEPKADKDDELCRKLNEYLNNPPAPGSSRGGEESDLQNLLGGMNQQQLMQLLGMGGMSGLSSLMSSGRSSSAMSESNLPSHIQSSASSRSASTFVDSSHRPQTASSTPAPTSVASVQPSTTPSAAATGLDSSLLAPVAPPGHPPLIQLSDLQNILSGLEAMDESSPSEVDLSTSITAEAMIPVLSNPEVQQRLIALLPEATELTKSEAELRATVHSPQFQQALQGFSSALASGQLGPLMRQFGLDDDAVAAASSGDMLAFARAMQDALNKQRDQSKKADDDPQ